MSVDLWYEKEIEAMIKKVASLKNENEVRELFDRILTSREINDMGRRLKVIEMLDEGSSYCEIEQAVRVGPAIISRLSNKIGFGFRRTSKTSVKISRKKAVKNPSLKYKGAVPIHKLISG